MRKRQLWLAVFRYVQEPHSALVQYGNLRNVTKVRKHRKRQRSAKRNDAN
jgi:hypothetical protein